MAMGSGSFPRGGVRRLDTQRNLGVRPAEALLEFDWDVSLTPAFGGGTREGHLEYSDEPAAITGVRHHTGNSSSDCTGLSCYQ